MTGHDLKDLQLLLEQTAGKGINIYTHGEMLPAHAYPLLKKFSHLKGNFGTAWQNQQKEFDHIPAPILYTTCLLYTSFDCLKLFFQFFQMWFQKCRLRERCQFP